ncbi:Melatonin receptor type 1A [Trichoplax sp. H2]|nr:Melatonin receptor type 1A [Trichoplax sp. H2]|eukprot:RDD37726.1 Melatonin receptor type 1A [Trichoplax sp. H2]
MVLVAGNLSLTSKVILIPTLSFTFIFGTIGNILVCIAILTNRKLKTATNGFILSLAIADLLVCDITVPIALIGLFQDPRPRAALLAGELALSGVSSSQIQLAVISIDRYRGIVYPDKPRLTWKEVKYIVPPLWLLAITETCLVVFNWPHDIRFALIHFYWFWFIATITIICYTLIWRNIVLHNQDVAGALRHLKQARIKKEKRAFIMIMLVVCCLLLCWSPAAIIYGIFLMQYTDKSVSDSMREPLNVLVAFGYFNSCINPFIYNLMNSTFRSTFRKILTNFCRRIRGRSLTKVSPIPVSSSSVQDVRRIAVNNQKDSSTA